jgi:hypothetical protein
MTFISIISSQIQKVYDVFIKIISCHLRAGSVVMFKYTLYAICFITVSRIHANYFLQATVKKAIYALSTPPAFLKHSLVYRLRYW